MKKRKLEDKSLLLDHLDNDLSDDLSSVSQQDFIGIIDRYKNKVSFLKVQYRKQVNCIIKEALKEIILKDLPAYYNILSNIATYSKRCKTPEQCKQCFKNKDRRWCSVCDDMLWNSISKCDMITNINNTLHVIYLKVCDIFNIEPTFYRFLSSNYYPYQLNDWDVINMIHDNKDEYYLLYGRKYIFYNMSEKLFDFDGFVAKNYKKQLFNKKHAKKKSTLNLIDTIIECVHPNQQGSFKVSILNELVHNNIFYNPTEYDREDFFRDEENSIFAFNHSYIHYAIISHNKFLYK